MALQQQQAGIQPIRMRQRPKRKSANDTNKHISQVNCDCNYHETHSHTGTYRHTQAHTNADAQSHRRTDTHRHTQTHTDTQTHADTQTHRHTDTQTHRHTDTQTHRHKETQTQGTKQAYPTQTHKNAHTDTQTHTHTHTRVLKIEGPRKRSSIAASERDFCFCELQKIDLAANTFNSNLLDSSEVN